jgi:hypothetical protein
MKVPLTSEVGTPKASARFWRTAWLSVSLSRSVCTRTVLLPTTVTLTARWPSPVAPMAWRAMSSYVAGSARGRHPELRTAAELEPEVQALEHQAEDGDEHDDG